MRHLVLTVMLLAVLPAFADDAPILAEARKVASTVPPKLLQVLSEEIVKGGPESAIGGCRDKAPEMARAASEQTGWTIRRVSLRNRNPKAVPDTWERAALDDFDRRAAAGENPATLEKGEVVANGAADSLSPAVKAQLKQHYPDDKAIVGYSLGQIRGAMTIRKAM